MSRGSVSQIQHEDIWVTLKNCLLFEEKFSTRKAKEAHGEKKKLRRMGNGTVTRFRCAKADNYHAVKKEKHRPIRSFVSSGNNGYHIHILAEKAAKHSIYRYCIWGYEEPLPWRYIYPSEMKSGRSWMYYLRKTCHLVGEEWSLSLTSVGMSIVFAKSFTSGNKHNSCAILMMPTTKRAWTAMLYNRYAFWSTLCIQTSEARSISINHGCVNTPLISYRMNGLFHIVEITATFSSHI